MINREMQTVQVLTYTTTRDDYGQIRQDTPTSRNVDMMIKLYSQANTNNPRYVDVEKIGITEDKLITITNQILIGTEKYNILFLIPSGKYLQVMMKKC